MNLVYQIGILFYKFAALFASMFSEKARQWSAGQRNSFAYLEKEIKSDKPIIWVHAASLGEFEQGRPLIEQIKDKHPNYQILLTFFSPSGYEIRKNYEGADYICYLPADTKKNARKFIELVNPEKVFFVKYEYWKNYISILNKKNIPLYLVSAIFRKDQLFFKNDFRGRWYRKILEKVTFFFVQNQMSADLLENLGLKNYAITGDTRFDRVAEIASNRKKLPIIEQFKGESPLIIAGSSWEPDEKLLASFANENPNVKFVFAPHEVKESNIKRLTGLFNDQAIRYSQAQNIDLSSFQILIVDSIGLLSSIYRYADISYIGGGFGVGIHNTLEAAIYNTPVLFGPNHLKFQEAVSLIENKIAFPINNQDELNNTLNDLLSNPQKRNEITITCEKFMNQNIGATEYIIKKVFNN